MGRNNHYHNHILLSIMLIALLVLSSLTATAFSTQGHIEKRDGKVCEENIYSSSIDDEDDGDDGDESGPGDIPDPGVPPSVPPGQDNGTDKIGGFTGTTGSFVSFETTDEGISDHSLRLRENENLSIFDKITVENFGTYQEKITGHTYTLQGNAIEMRIYDNPSALIKLNVNSLEDERKVSFRTGDMEVTEEGKGTVEMRFEDSRAENYVGTLMPLEDEKKEEVTPEIEGNSINYAIEDQTTFIFQLRGDDEVSTHITEEISNGDIGAELRIESEEDKLNLMPISYRDVTLMGQMRHDNKLEIMASSETLGDEGTVLFLDISSNVMDISSPEDIQLSIDGEIASVVDDYRGVKDTNGPAYWLNIGEEGIQLLVSVSHFSSRSITIEYPEEISKEYLGSLAYYLPSAGISLILVTLGALYRKGEKKNKKKNGKEKDRKGKGDNLVAIGSDPTTYNRSEGNEKRIKNPKKDKKQETRIRKE